MAVTGVELWVPGNKRAMAAGNNNGAFAVLDDIDMAIARGKGFQLYAGTLTTGIVGGGAGTVLDINQPEMAIGIPKGTAIRPIRVSAQVQVGLAAADNDENEILLAVDSRGYWIGDGTFTNRAPHGMRTDMYDTAGACKVGIAFTGNMTTRRDSGVGAAPDLTVELDREVETFDIFSTGVNAMYKRLKLLYEPLHPPLIVGPATLLLYFGGTVANVGGFAQASWVEETVEMAILRG